MCSTLPSPPFPSPLAVECFQLLYMSLVTHMTCDHICPLLVGMTGLSGWTPHLTCTSSCSSLLTSSSPPISSQVTVGTSTTVSRSAEGFVWFIANYERGRKEERMREGKEEGKKAPIYIWSDVQVCHQRLSSFAHFDLFLISLFTNPNPNSNPTP